MPTEAPAEEDPDAFHEGHAFTAAADDEEDEWETFFDWDNERWADQFD